MWWMLAVINSVDFLFCFVLMAACLLFPDDSNQQTVRQQFRLGFLKREGLCNFETRFARMNNSSSKRTHYREAKWVISHLHVLVRPPLPNHHVGEVEYTATTAPLVSGWRHGHRGSGRIF